MSKLKPNVLQVKPVSVLSVALNGFGRINSAESTSKDLVGLGTAACVGLRVKLSEKVLMRLC